MSVNRKALVHFFHSIMPVPLAALEDITMRFSEYELAKGDFFLKAGRSADLYFFLEKGFLKAYTVQETGEEAVTAFYGANTVVFEAASFFNRSVSKENMVALADCHGWIISFEQLNDLFHTVPAFRELGRAILVRSLVQLKQRVLSMASETAEERYARLLQQNPEVFQYAPLKDIASYLGITDTSLSRIRRSFSQK